VKYLSIHADDVGLTDGVTKGIIESMANGIVNNSSAMVCVEGSEKRIKSAKRLLHGKMGIHLQLTGGIPCLTPKKIPTLINFAGEFPRNSESLSYKLKSDEIFSEWDAQIRRLIKWGVEPQYLDSHHSVHLLPHVINATVGIAKKYNLPVRSANLLAVHHSFKSRGVNSAQLTTHDLFGAPINPVSFMSIVERKMKLIENSGILELVCHPGYSDADLCLVSRYNMQREMELQLFLDKKLIALLLKRGIMLKSTKGWNGG
jgi:predicted glycoside hydrolase/deacetylase ChbG (UPF0249 family)